jgi:hypothetical protein
MVFSRHRRVRGLPRRWRQGHRCWQRVGLAERKRLIERRAQTLGIDLLYQILDV